MTTTTERQPLMCQRVAMVQPGQFKTREEGNERYIEGYFARFGDYYQLWDGAMETIAPGAFDDTLGEDIRALVNHDTTLVLGRNRANTLTLRPDAIGLWGSILINQADSDAMNAWARVQRGDVSQCSFGFDILDQTAEYRDDGSVLWTLQKVKLYEVSIVTFPAYESTSVQARRKDYADLQKKKRELWRAKMLARLKGENHGTEDPDAAAQH